MPQTFNVRDPRRSRYRPRNAASRLRKASALAACVLAFSVAPVRANETPADEATPTPGPTASAPVSPSTAKPSRAILDSREAHAWAKSAHGTLGSSTPSAGKTAPASPAAADEATPTISSVAATPTTVHSGDTVRWDVRTSANVVSVEAHVTLATLQLQRAAPGHFTLAFTIPTNAPGLFHGTYNVDMIAKASDGLTATKTISLTFD